MKNLGKLLGSAWAQLSQASGKRLGGRMGNGIITGAILLAFVGTGPAVAEPSSNVAFDSQTRALLRLADKDRGKTLAEQCADCHGEKGIINDTDFVNIAGLSASYIYKQLIDYKDRKRENRDMRRAVNRLDQGAIADLAVWYASLTPAKRSGQSKPDAATLKLIYKGDPKRLIHACSACHGAKGAGGQFDHPRIAGQNKGYLVQTLMDFKNGDRANDIYSRMRVIAKELNDAEINALADYYATALKQ